MPKASQDGEKLSPVLAGVAGEYFVAAELTTRGYIASITMRNTRGVDILCSNSDVSKEVGIQVKTNSSSKREWMLNEKAEDYFADNLFYIFVNLNSNKQPPDYFVVPSKVVAVYARETHKVWSSTPRRDGKPHSKNAIRKFRDIEEQYLERWELLGL